MGLGTAVRGISGTALLAVALSAGPGTGLEDADAAAPTSAGAPIVHTTIRSNVQRALTWQVGPLPDGGSPIAMSSPTVARFPGGPAAVVGDRAGRLYAYYLAGDGSGGPRAVPGWPVSVGAPVDSTPSVAYLGGPYGTIFVGSGDDQFPTAGGYHAYNANGGALWNARVVNPPEDTAPAGGVAAGLTVTALQGRPAVMAGSLGQEAYALNAGSGATLTGWPFFTSDSTHSTAAAADLYGTGQSELVEGGDQTAGFALGQQYSQGGHLRILTGTGTLLCNANVDQTVDSSPAVGGFLPGGVTGEVVGTGAFFPGARASDQVLAFDTRCNPRWATTLDYATSGSPALARVEGGPQMQVVEGTSRPDHGAGSVWVLDGATGRPICRAATSGAVIGSVVTADLTGGGTQDLLVPTVDGVDVFDSHCSELATIAASGVGGAYVLGFQNSPLVTVDPNGSIGITLAGYGGPAGGSGYIEHYEVTGSNGPAAVGSGAWPMFHHDPQLTGDAGGTTARGAIPSCSVPDAVQPGYDLVASDGGIFSFGPPFCGSTGAIRLTRPVVGMAMAADTGGYWFVASDGGIFAFGDAHFYGSTGAIRLKAPVVGMAATPDGRGYWLVAADGGIFAFGDAHFYGSTGAIRLHARIVGMAATADGFGYRLVAADGGIFDFGDARFYGSMGARHLTRPVVGMAVDGATGGYWEVASDGGVFAFNAPFYGSTGALRLNAPIVGMRPTGNGYGYRFVASDGGVFDFGDAGFYGSVGGRRLSKPVVGLSGF
jgi:hypothetical protein